MRRSCKNANIFFSLAKKVESHLFFRIYRCAQHWFCNNPCAFLHPRRAPHSTPDASILHGATVISLRSMQFFSENLLTRTSPVCYNKFVIEAHRTKSIAHEKPPRLCEKGVGAEVSTVAGALLAMRKTSVLLSQKCGVLSRSAKGVFCRCEIAPRLSFLFCYTNDENISARKEQNNEKDYIYRCRYRHRDPPHTRRRGL